MINLGITSAQTRELILLLQSHHTIGVTIRILDTTHNYIADVSSMLVDGQVTFDAGATDSDRSLDLTLLDPLKSVQLDPQSPSPVSLYVANMISIMYSVRNPATGVQYNIPVFCGPVNKVDRNGIFLNVKCLGKEVLSSDTMWYGRGHAPGNKITDIIRVMLQESGETKMDIPDLANTVGYVYFDRNTDVAKSTWGACKWLASLIGYQLYYDGRGVAVMKPYESFPVMTFNDRNIKTKPQYGYDLQKLSNCVLVIGGEQGPGQPRIEYRLVAPDTHPLSPRNVGRNGQPRYINPIVIDDSNITSIYQAQQVAQNELNDALLMTINAAFDTLPIPILEPNDVVTINYDGFGLNTRVSKWTLPLLCGGSGTIGYLRKTMTLGRPVLDVRN